MVVLFCAVSSSTQTSTVSLCLSAVASACRCLHSQATNMAAPSLFTLFLLPLSLSSSSLFHALPPPSLIFIYFSCVLAVVYYIWFTFQPSFVSISRRQENVIPQKKKKMFKGDKKPRTVIDLNVSFWEMIREKGHLGLWNKGQKPFCLCVVDNNWKGTSASIWTRCAAGTNQEEAVDCAEWDALTNQESGFWQHLTFALCCRVSYVVPIRNINNNSQ